MRNYFIFVDVVEANLIKSGVDDVPIPQEKPLLLGRFRLLGNSSNGKHK